MDNPRVELDDNYYFETIYRGERFGKHLWDFNVVDDGDTIVYFVEFPSEHRDERAAVQELLDYEGPIKCDWTKVIWWYMPW